VIDRNIPYYNEEHNIIIPTDRQFLNITVGARGSGKSALQEFLLELLFEAGWSVFDAWSAGFEAMFYCINLDCKKKRDDEIKELEHKMRIADLHQEAEEYDRLDEELINKKNELGCTCHKRYPITVLCNEVVNVDPIALDKINGVCYTKKEYVEKMRKQGEVVVEYDDNEPPVKPLSERGTEWIKIVKLPTPNVKDGTKNNQEIKRIFVDAVVECRKSRRILTYIPPLFPTSFIANRTLGVILEGLKNGVLEEHLKPFTETELGKPKSKFSKLESCYHQFCLLLREVGELAEDGMYSDPNAKYIKRHIQGIVRVSRHKHLSILFDLQRLEDFSKKIRSQVSSIIMRRTPNKLLGDELKFVHDWIEKKQEKEFEKFGYSPESRHSVYSKFPPLKQLNRNFAYVIYSDDWISKWEIPTPKHHHKQEDDDIEKLIGFRYNVNWAMLESQKGDKNTQDTINNEDKELFDFMETLRNPKVGKPEKWKNIQKILSDKQKHGIFQKRDSFEKMNPESIRIWHKRKLKKLEKT